MTQPVEWIKNKAFMVRWGASARNWPIERFAPTTDLNLTPAQWGELTNGMHSWRQLIPWYLARYGADLAAKQFYCFGVAHGSTVAGLVTGLRHRSMPVPHLHLFDSFEGLPDETAGISKPSVWQVGAYAAPRTKLEARIKSLDIPETNYSIHQGWFNETLQESLVSSGAFRPAAYVDIDADLYSSTRDVLDFLFGHGLIAPGCLIGYDDWGDTELWTAGESRAHDEVLAKYSAKCAQLFSWGEPPHIKKLFLVVSVG